MKELIGMCIDNTAQISTSVGVQLNISERIEKISEIIKGEEQD